MRCFSSRVLLLSFVLKPGLTPEALRASATSTQEDALLTVTKMKLKVRERSSALSQEAKQQLLGCGADPSL